MKSTGFTKKTDLTALKTATLLAQVLQGHRVPSSGQLRAAQDPVDCLVAGEDFT